MRYIDTHSETKIPGSRRLNKASLLKARFILWKKDSRRIKNVFLLALIFTSLVTSLPIFSASPASAATMASGMSIEDQVKSFLYYRALGSCMASQSNGNLIDGGGLDVHARITQAHVKSYEWFASFNNGAEGSSAPIGPYMRGELSDVGSDYKISCDQSALAKGALTVWGNWKPDEALCAFGFRRADDTEFNLGRCTDAQQGTDEFKAGDDISSKYQKAVKDRVYGGAEPSLSAAANYLLYLGVFQQSCAYGVSGTTTAPNGSGERDYAVQQVQDDHKVATVYYTGRTNMKKTDQVIVAPANARNADEIRESCSWVVDRINENAKAYVAATVTSNTPVNPTPGTTSGTPGPGDNKTTCVVDGTGWIVCTVMRTLAAVMDGIYQLLELFLKVRPLSTDIGSESNTLYQSWGVMRNIANIAFVIAFLIIIYSQLTGMGVTNYNIKKMLPRLVVAAILVNTSYWVCAVAVDASNILGVGIKDLLVGLRDNLGAVSVKMPLWEQIIGPLLAGSSLVVTGGAVAAVAATSAAPAIASAALWVAIPAVLGAILAVFVAFAVLAARQALIIILIVLSPLAFVAYLLPNTEKFFDLWRKSLTTMLVFFPLFSIIFAGSQLASIIIIGSAGSASGAEAVGGTIVIAMLVQVAPLILTPLLIKFSGGLIGRFAGMINNKNRGLIDRAKKVRNQKVGNIGRSAMNAMPNKYKRGPLKGRRSVGGMMQSIAQRSYDGRQDDQELRNVLDGEISAASNVRRDRQSLIERAGRVEDAQRDMKTMESQIKEGTRPVTLDARLRLNEHELEVTKNQADQRWKEMRAQGAAFTPDPSLGLGARQTANMVDLATRANDSAMTSRAVESAASMAQSTETENYAKRIAVDNALAEAAGGIHDHGEARVRALARATTVEASNKAIAAEKTTMRDLKVSDSSQPTDLTRESNDPSNSLERRLAASSMINVVSNPKDLLGTIDDLSTQLQVAVSSGNTAEAEVIRAKQQQFMEDAGGKLPMSINGQTKGELAAGTFTGSSAANILDTLNTGGYSGEKFANMTHHELGVIRDTLVANSAALAGNPYVAKLKDSINEYNTAAATLGKGPTVNIAKPMNDILGI